MVQDIENFKVICDETINTSETLNQNELHVEATFIEVNIFLDKLRRAMQLPAHLIDTTK